MSAHPVRSRVPDAPKLIASRLSSTRADAESAAGDVEPVHISCLRCRLCGSVGSLSLLLTNQRSNLLSCAECGVAFVDPLPDPASMVSHFRNDYITDDVHLEKIYGTSRKAALQLIARVVRRHKKTGRVLDVGCAGGYFLYKYFDSRVWDKFGVEPSRYALRRAAARRIATYEGEVGSVDLPEASFDVITMAGVLPYFRSPQRELRILRQAIKPDGVIVIELPLGLTQIWRHTTRLGQITGGGSRSILESPHIFFYNANSLRLLFSEAGFNTASLEPAPGNDQPTLAQKMFFRMYYRASQIASSATAERLMLGPGVVAVITPATN